MLDPKARAERNGEHFFGEEAKKSSGRLGREGVTTSGVQSIIRVNGRVLTDMLTNRQTKKIQSIRDKTTTRFQDEYEVIWNGRGTSTA